MTQGAPRICAVVVTYNRLAKLKLALARLLAEPLDHIVVVDNASDDGTAAYLAGLNDSRLDNLRLERNMGGAGGFEAGLRHAVAQYDPDWALLQDDDAWPDPGAISAFRSADTSEWDAVAGAVRYPDGAICDMNRPLLNPFRNLRVFLRTALGGGRRAFHMADDSYDSTAPVPVDGGAFVGLFLSRRAIKLAGYPDGRLFIYADDALYCLTLRKAGGRIAFLPALRFTHDCTSFDAGGALVPDWKVYFYHRNVLILYRAAAGVLFWPAMLVILPKWLIRLWSGGDNRRDRARLMLWGLRDGLRRDTHLTLAGLQSKLARTR
ncbi:Galactofuranosyltransferase GlfT1 [Roseibaca ekhonensis]|uniref:Galactofuranosyltransferase GlfT1 n=1 Tax=Roseinatronobacter ekhonensis TaxID=254356 RepID=A0A3B0MFQ7_9RHOB|nr:glycosyltransferase [Roseibaca ekhonensis]SUZ32388.1 Galactofuranosyltransferase GlfT1 [Roseibaca ekhonensis]